MSHQSPPTLPEETCSHRVGNAKQVDLLPADHARLSLSELGQCAGYLMTRSHVESLRMRQTGVPHAPKSVDTWAQHLVHQGSCAIDR
jgi:hypothetical protein